MILLGIFGFDFIGNSSTRLRSTLLINFIKYFVIMLGFWSVWWNYQELMFIIRWLWNSFFFMIYYCIYFTVWLFFFKKLPQFANGETKSPQINLALPSSFPIKDGGKIPRSQVQRNCEALRDLLPVRTGRPLLLFQSLNVHKDFSW